MGALSVVESQRLGNRFQHRGRRAGNTTAFQLGVVLDTDPGQTSDLTAAQAGHTSLADVGQADIGGGQFRSAGGQELAHLGLVVHRFDATAAPRRQGCPAGTPHGRDFFTFVRGGCIDLDIDIERTPMTPTTDQSRDVLNRAPMVLSAAVLSTIVLITAIAPLATDMYVPAFPLVGRDLDASATQVQLTLTTFFVGMALGQLVGGPASDRIGRRVPLLVSLAVLAVASVVCAFSPTIAVMMLARLVQGFSGGWAMVIARSIVVDLTRGAQLVRAMNLVAGVSGIAPIVGPLIGGVILQFSHWRVSFWVVAALAALMFVAVAVGMAETLPADKRHGGGLSHIMGTTKAVLRHRSFVGYLLVFGSSMG